MRTKRGESTWEESTGFEESSRQWTMKLSILAAAGLFFAPPPPSAIHTGNAEHYRWGDCCDGWHLVKTGSLSAIEERMPPGAAETRHVHAKAQQFFYVLAGEASLEMGGKTVPLKAGEGALVPAGTPHQMRNGSRRAAAVYRDVSTAEPWGPDESSVTARLRFSRTTRW